MANQNADLHETPQGLNMLEQFAFWADIIDEEESYFLQNFVRIKGFDHSDNGEPLQISPG